MKHNNSWISLIVLFLVMLLVMAGCRPEPSTTPSFPLTSTPATTNNTSQVPPSNSPVPPSNSPPPPSTTTTVLTFEQAAVNGAAVFAAFCAGCHGAEGQGGIGPALIGTDVELDDYGTADVLLGFISSEMPQNAPGSLQTQQYLEVTAYLLVKNNIVWPGNPFDPAKFNGIRLPD